MIRGWLLGVLVWAALLPGKTQEALVGALTLAAGSPLADESIEFFAGHPDALLYAVSFPESYGKKRSYSLAGEVEKGEIPLFLQWDRRWGYEPYGSGLLAMTGCGPVCLSMVACGLTGDTRWSPDEVARLSMEKKYYEQGVGTSWALMTGGAQAMGLEAREIPLDAGYMVATLQSGEAIICSMRPGDFTKRGHFIVLAGVDETGGIVVRDPNSRQNSARSWEIDRLIPQIKGLWAYKAR